MTTLLWFYLGGIVGQVALTASNDDAARGLRRAAHRAGASVTLGYLIGLAFWPLTVLASLIFKQQLIRRIDKLQEAEVLEVSCRVCGFVDEARISHKRWLQEPPYWYTDVRDEEGMFCSYACALHHATYHERKE